jgi:hypothetical protein
MATSINAKIQNIDIDVTGGSSFKTLVCLQNFSVNTQAKVTTEDTNCAQFSATGIPSMSISFNAICTTDPSGTEVTYNSLLQAVSNSSLINARVQNPTVTGASVGTVYYHQFYGYVSDVKLDQATGDVIKFSGTINSTGVIDTTV